MRALLDVNKAGGVGPKEEQRHRESSHDRHDGQQNPPQTTATRAIVSCPTRTCPNAHTRKSVPERAQHKLEP